MILFNLICNMSMFWKKRLLNPIPRVGGGGQERVFEQNICYHVGAFLILFNLICNMTKFWKSWILTYCPHLQDRGGSRGSTGKIFATMLVHFWFSLIWYATWPCSEKVDFWPIDRVRGFGGSAGKIFATMLLHFVIPFNLISNTTMSWKSWILTYWPHS